MAGRSTLSKRRSHLFVLAQPGQEGGPNVEMLGLGVAFAILGAVLLVQRGLDRRAAVALAVAGLLVVVGAFTVFAEDTDRRSEEIEAITIGGRQVAVSELQGAVGAICRAMNEGDPRVEERIFANRVHDQMHLLAQALEEDHRKLEGALLEAIVSVEADLAGNSASSLASLTGLRDRAAAGLEALSIEPPACAQ